MSTAAATTEEIKSATKYTYDYTHLPPLAMVGAVTEAEAFSARRIGFIWSRARH